MISAVELNYLIKEIDDLKEVQYNRGFEIAKLCSSLIIEKNYEQARKITIHMLGKRNGMANGLADIWDDIAESLGFYPYLQKEKITSLSDSLRRSYHKSAYLPGIYLHQSQKTISDKIFRGVNVALSAPTSYGKSLLIEEIVASHKFHNIVIIQPTLALLDETRIKLLKYQESYKLIVRSTQAYNKMGDNIFLLTAERVMEYEVFPQIDFLIIDEFYKISYARDDDRVDILNNAFMRIYYSYHPQFYFLGPNIPAISQSFIEDFKVEFIATDYNLVDSVVSDETKNFQTQPEKLRVLFDLLRSFPEGDQTLVYCSSPDTARMLALAYYDFLCEKEVEPKYVDLPLIEWINKEISPSWSILKELAYGIAIHDAAMPKHLGASIINYFNHHKLDVIFCTPTIIEGVNTSAKNVVVYSDTKGNKNLDFFDYSNIKGRAGRLMEHFVGRVYNFINVPCQQSLNIDMPFSDQDKLSNEVLLNIPEDKIRPQLKERYEQLHNLPEDLLVLLSKNGMKIKNQIALIKLVQDKLNANERDFIWSRYPTWDGLLSTLNLLASSKLISFDNRVKTAKQLCLFLTRYAKYKNIMNYFYSFSSTDNSNFDKRLEDVFYVQRRWFQYMAPKALRVCESLVNYVCAKRNIHGCSYSYYAQQIETNFLPEDVSLLLEYGIPAATIRKIKSFVPDGMKEESLIPYLKNNKTLNTALLRYEVDLISENL